jgi:integrase
MRGRPRKDGVLWTDATGKTYIRARRGEYSIYDGRGAERTETTRRDLGDALDIARHLAGQAPREPRVPRLPRVPTLAEVAADFFERGLPVWADDGEIARAPKTVEQLRSIVRNWFTEFLFIPVNKLPEDFIARAELAARARKRSVGLQNKIAGMGKRLVKFAQHLGYIAPDAQFRRPLQRVVEKKVKRKGQELKVMNHDLPSLRSVLHFARAFAEHTGRRDLRLFWWIAFFVGPRIGELCALTPTDVVRRDGRTWLSFTKKVAPAADGKPERIEHHTKGYERRDVVVPRFLESAVWRQRDHAIAAGWSYLFAPWSKRIRRPWISQSTIHDVWVTVGASIGWEINTRTKQADYPHRARGTVVQHKARVQSLVYHPHNARAFAATTMHAERRGLAVHGMGMSVHAIARQLGDKPETVRAHYLGIIDEADTYLARVVP